MTFNRIFPVGILMFSGYSWVFLRGWMEIMLVNFWYEMKADGDDVD